MLPTYLLFSVHAVRKLVRMTLQMEGYSVQEELSPAELLSHLRQVETDPSLVLFGDYVPGMQLLTLLREMQQPSQLRHRHGFLLLSTQARALPANITTLMHEMQIPVLALPFETEQLMTRVKDLQTHLALN
jgi:CheY-like chemotaxis protein